MSAHQIALLIDLAFGSIE